MKPTLSLPALAAAAALMAGATAHANTITISTFSLTDFTNATIGGVVEDFEALGETLGEGELPAGPFGTSVGTFEAITGGVGTGGTCGILGSPACSQLGLSKDNAFSQGNLIPDDGEWSLNSNDGLGMVWEAALGGAREFKRLVFAIKDAADIGSIRVDVSVEDWDADTIRSIGPSAGDGNEQLVVIDFSSFVPMATVLIENSADQPDDSFSIDGATAVVPLPAAGWMLLAGIGGLVAMKRRRQKA